MDKNARIDIEKFFSNYFFDILGLLVVGGAAMITSYFTNLPPFIVGVLLLIFFVSLIFFLKIRYWRKKKERGFVIISEKSTTTLNEGEKFLWLEIRSKDEFSKLKINVILKRLTLGDKITSPDLIIGKENRPFVKKIEVENIPEKVIIAKGIEDDVHILLDEFSFPLKIITSLDEFHQQENHEIVIEVNGKINEIYFFSELYKGIFAYTCTKAPNIFVGEIDRVYRTTQIKWNKFDRWSENEENNRNTTRNIEFEKNKKIIFGN